jgi:4-amino-4-deoxy-L-arabinose transferase-like glycosyltransferase
MDDSVKLNNPKKLVWVILLALVVFGAYLRFYHADYPSIGYHNWKEARYVTAARNFDRDGFFAHGFFVPEYDYPAKNENVDGIHSDFFPVSAIAAAVMFKIFGLELWAARLPVILFSLLAIPLMFFFIRKLFGRDDMALVAAGLTTISPLFVFFSHNVDQMPFGFVFMLAAWIFFFRWIDNDKWHDLVLASLFTTLAIVTKYTYGICFIPFIFIFPWSRLKEWKVRMKTLAASGVLVLLSPAWWWYSGRYIVSVFGGLPQGEDKIRIAALFEPETMAAVKPYLADNYTLVGVLFAVLGIVVFALMWKKLEKRTRWFMVAYCASSLLLPILVSESLRGHSYHQFPLASVFIIFMALFITVAGNTIGSFLRFPGSKALVMVALFLVPVPVFSYAVSGLGSSTLYFSSMEAKDRQFDTQFFGLDVAGDYIKQHKQPGDRLIRSSHQAYGILWHGDIKGMSLPGTVEDYRFYENKWNASWLFLYQWNFDIFSDPERSAIKDHISQNYHLVQIGFVNRGQPAPVYMLLRKGGNFSVDDINTMLAGKSPRSKNYELTSGPVKLEYINIEP